MMCLRDEGKLDRQESTAYKFVIDSRGSLVGSFRVNVVEGKIATGITI